MQSGAPKFIESSSLAWEAALWSGSTPAAEAATQAPLGSPLAAENGLGTQAFAASAAQIIAAGNETEAEQVTHAAAEAFLEGQPEAAVALAQVGATVCAADSWVGHSGVARAAAPMPSHTGHLASCPQAVAATMAFGPSPAIDALVAEALGLGGDFASYMATGLATAAANLVNLVGATAQPVSAAFAQAVGKAAAQDFSQPASQAFAAALAVSPRLAMPLSDAVADMGDASPSPKALAEAWAQATAAAATRGASDEAAYAMFAALTAGGPFSAAYGAALNATGASEALCRAFEAAKVKGPGHASRPPPHLLCWVRQAACVCPQSASDSGSLQESATAAGAAAQFDAASGSEFSSCG